MNALMEASKALETTQMSIPIKIRLIQSPEAFKNLT